MALNLMIAGALALTFLLWTVGVTCCRIESLLIKWGEFIGMGTCAFQTVLLTSWLIENYRGKHNAFSLGMCFFCSLISVLLEGLAIMFAKKHRRIEIEALEIMLTLDDEDSPRKILERKKSVTSV